jgi:hypothetical protein
MADDLISNLQAVDGTSDFNYFSSHWKMGKSAFSSSEGGKSWMRED